MRHSHEREFEQYVLASRGRLVRFATLMCGGDRHRAEDAVQVALTRVFFAWGRVEEGTRDAYVRRTVVNAVIDEGRRRTFRSELPVAELPDVAAADETPLDLDAAGAVFAALAALPAKMRAAVVLRYIDGMSVAEAAVALRCSQGTVKSQAARALGKMRAALFEYDEAIPA
jgi:RNA polymerase sigma-70 factor (sigma-E family)